MMIFGKLKRLFRTPSLLAVIIGAALLLAGCHSDTGPDPMPTGYKYHHNEYKAPDGPEPLFRKFEHWLFGEDQEVVESHANQEQDFAARSSALESDVSDAYANTESPSAASYMKTDGAESATSYRTPSYRTTSRETTPTRRTGRDMDQVADSLVRSLTQNFGQPTEAVFLAHESGLSSYEVPLRASLKTALRAQGWSVTDDAGVSPFSMTYTIVERGGDTVDVAVMLKSTGDVVAKESRTTMLSDTSPKSISGTLPDTGSPSDPPEDKAAASEPISLIAP